MADEHLSRSFGLTFIVGISLLFFLFGYILISSRISWRIQSAYYRSSPSPGVVSASPKAGLSFSQNGWKQHVNTQLKLSFSAPAEVLIQEQKVNILQQEKQTVAEFTLHQTDSSNRFFALYYLANPQRLSLDELSQSLQGDVGDPVGLISDDDVLVQIPGSFTARHSRNHYCVSRCESYTWEDGDRVYQFINYPVSIFTNQSQTFEKIFSTFHVYSGK